MDEWFRLMVGSADDVPKNINSITDSPEFTLIYELILNSLLSSNLSVWFIILFLLMIFYALLILYIFLMNWCKLLLIIMFEYILP